MSEQAYLDLLKDIMKNGVDKKDRTGVGTRSLFGRQLRFDLSQGFPLLTTKKMFIRGTIEELLWFLSGSTDVNILKNKNVHIWDSWVGEDGTIGPGYGKQFRNIEYLGTVKPKLFDPVPSPVRNPTVFGVGELGDYPKKDPVAKMLQPIWRDMLRRCYYKNCTGYLFYGAKGVHVDTKWFTFANFYEDVKKLPNWCLKLEWPEDYTLDKDVMFASNRYAPDTCMWATHSVQSANTSTNAYFSAVDKNGNQRLFSSIGQIHRECGLNVSAVHRCLNGKLKTHHGWSNFSYAVPPQDHVYRYLQIDQLKSVVASLKHDPYSRRHIISLWNPHEIDKMTLPPCHGNIIQFYVCKGKLSCSMYQRSGDMFLGVPVNIASYAFFTHMLAQVAGYEVGEFIHTIGDCHIYSNHFIQVQEQLKRPPKSLPVLELDKNIKSIDDFSLDSFKIVGYDPHPTIRGEVAI